MNLSPVLKDLLDVEKRVLRRKAKFLSEVLVVDDAILKRLLGNDFLGDQEYRELRQVLPERRCGPLVEILLQKERPFLDTFISVCESANAAVVMEMRAELKLEQGTLECTETEMEEANALVHRHFGSSRRIPETEKRKIARLIAMKAQVSRDSNKRQLARISEELSKYRSLAIQMETRLFDINARIKRFVRVNELEVQNPYCDLRSTTDVLMGRPKSPDKDLVSDLEERVTFLMSRLMRLSAENDTLIRFRRADRVPGDIGQSSTLMPAIHITEHHVTTTTGFDLVSATREKRRKSSINQDALRERCFYLEAEVKTKDGLLEEMREEVRLKQKQIMFMRGLLHAVGLNVTHEMEQDGDVKKATKGTILVKGRLTKTKSPAAIWAKPDTSFPPLFGANHHGNQSQNEIGNLDNSKGLATGTAKKAHVPSLPVGLMPKSPRKTHATKITIKKKQQ